jgi:hypothetical protein
MKAALKGGRLRPARACLRPAGGVHAGKWVLDTTHSLAMIQTVSMVRWRSRGSALGLIFASLLVLSIAAAAFHYQLIARFCANRPCLPDGLR